MNRLPISEGLIVFALGSAAAFPVSARKMMTLSLLDWAAIGRAGALEPVSLIVTRMLEAEGGAPQANVFGRAIKLPARAAALANGTISHALDYDDTHFGHIGHPSVAILPAVLALGQARGISGDKLLEAALIGVEIACRIGAWLGRAHYQLGFHQTATSGCFGAALASARLLGLNAVQAGHALGIASTRASGLKSQFGTMGKPFHAGMAAANGVEAALLAEAGFVSVPDGLECEQGFGPTHAGETFAPEAVLAGLGEEFRFETVQHKFHACCHGTHAAIEALHSSRVQHELAAERIKEVWIKVHPRWLRVCDLPAPKTGLEAKFSYRLTAAMALAGQDTSALDTFSEAACTDPALRALRDVVRVQTDESLAETEAQTLILCKDGEQVSNHYDLAAPMSLAAREAKLVMKAAALLGKTKSQQLYQAILRMETMPAEEIAAEIFG